MHYDKSETLDNFPILDPKKFTSPTTSGRRLRGGNSLSDNDDSDVEDDDDDQGGDEEEDNEHPSGERHDAVLVHSKDAYFAAVVCQAM